MEDKYVKAQPELGEGRGAAGNHLQVACDWTMKYAVPSGNGNKGVLVPLPIVPMAAPS